jgi:saccharopine dehydrogenase (NAD+, L-lysine-forming)
MRVLIVGAGGVGAAAAAIARRRSFVEHLTLADVDPARAAAAAGRLRDDARFASARRSACGLGSVIAMSR